LKTLLTKAWLPALPLAVGFLAAACGKAGGGRQGDENPRIKELAANKVSAQKREIEQMKQWRQQWYQEG
jgi:uncharacterized protein (DUF305 family)